MRCDAYADEDGVVCIRFNSYDEPEDVMKESVLIMDNFEPYERVSMEWIHGEPR